MLALQEGLSLNICGKADWVAFWRASPSQQDDFNSAGFPVAAFWNAWLILLRGLPFQCGVCSALRLTLES